MRRWPSLVMLITVAGMLVTVVGMPLTATRADAGDFAAPGPERFGVRLTGVPAAQARDPRATRYIVSYLKPGAVIHRSVEVVNESGSRARFSVYPDAARIAGGFFTGDAGAARSELTRWITVAHPVVSLGPYASAYDPVTIRVPKQATRGEHYGVIWVQQSARLRTSHGMNIREVARVGIRVYLAVGRGGAPPTRFAVTSVTPYRPAGRVPYFLVKVANNGGRAVDIGGSGMLTGGPGGSRVGPISAKRVITLAPGQSGELVFPLRKGLPHGHWRFSATLASGLLVRTARAGVTFPATVAVLPHGSGPAPVPVMIWIWAAGILLGLCVVLAVAVQRRRRNRRARYFWPGAYLR